MLYVRELMLDNKFQQSFNPKCVWASFLIWPQMCLLTMFQEKFSSNLAYMNYKHKLQAK